ncbi:RNA polymerase sigma factor [Actinokineospora sp. 24-640]
MDLAERFSRGEEYALVEVYRRFHRPMLSAAYGVLGDRELAAEAVQQAFVQAWRASASFDPSLRLSPWLYAIVRRAAIDVYRRGRRFAGEVPLDLLADGVVVVDAPCLDQAWTVVQVHRAIAQMPPDEAQVVRLAYFHGLTHTEISAQLRIPLGTVKSRSARAHRRLAKLLAHLGEPAVPATACPS